MDEHKATIVGSIGIRTVIDCACGVTIVGRGSFIDHVAVERARSEAKASN